MLLAANGPWNNSKGHLLFAGANVPNTCQGVPNTPPDGTSAMRQTSHHAVSPPLAFDDYRQILVVVATPEV